MNNPISPKVCIFCGNPGITGEHLWPEWASVVLNNDSNDQSRKRTEGRITHTHKTQLVAHKITKRQGTIASKKVRVVCGNCNSGWMSSIESAAKELLLPMMQGYQIELTREQQGLIARWMTLKAIVAQHHQLGDGVTSKTDIDLFLKHGTIPSSIHIWIARCQSSFWRTGYVRQAGFLIHGDSIPPDAHKDKDKNTHSISFGIGEVFFFLLEQSGYGVRLQELFIGPDPRVLIPLWPIFTENLIWPPMRMLSENDAHRLSTQFDDLMASDRVVWREVSEE